MNGDRVKCGGMLFSVFFGRCYLDMVVGMEVWPMPSALDATVGRSDHRIPFKLVEALVLAALGTIERPGTFGSLFSSSYSSARPTREPVASCTYTFSPAVRLTIYAAVRCVASSFSSQQAIEPRTLISTRTLSPRIRFASSAADAAALRGPDARSLSSGGCRLDVLNVKNELKKKPAGRRP